MSILSKNNSHKSILIVTDFIVTDTDQRRCTGKILLGELNIICPNETVVGHRCTR